MAEIRSVLDKNNCDYEQRERFVLLCVHGDPNTDSLVQWEIEVCKLPRLSLNGVRFKRISGTSIGFKNIASKIAYDLRLWLDTKSEEYHSVGSDTPQDDSGQGDDDGSDGGGAGGGCGGTDSVGGVSETHSDPEQKHGSETRNEQKEGGSRGDGVKERESNGKNALGVAIGEVNAGDVVPVRIRSKHSTTTPNKRWSLMVVDGRSSMRCKNKNKSSQQHHYHHHPHRHHLHQQEHRQQGTPTVDSFAKDSSAHLEDNERCLTPEKIAGYNHIFASLLRTTTL